MSNLTKEVETAVSTLAALAKFRVAGFGYGYQAAETNLSLAACDAAHEITGVSRTFCRMLNHKFRTDAMRMMLARAASKYGKVSAQ